MSDLIDRQAAIEALNQMKIMKCKDCQHLVKTTSTEVPGFYNLHCDKYDIYHYPVPDTLIDILNCVENQDNFKEVVRGETR